MEIKRGLLLKGAFFVLPKRKKMPTATSYIKWLQFQHTWLRSQGMETKLANIFNKAAQAGGERAKECKAMLVNLSPAGFDLAGLEFFLSLIIVLEFSPIGHSG